MTPKNKRTIYLFLFTALGLVLGVLIEALIELSYISLLGSDFNRYSFGLTWADLMQFRDFFAVLVLAACGLWGYRAGKYWWHEIYELKRRPWKHGSVFFMKKAVVLVIAVLVILFLVMVKFKQQPIGLNSMPSLKIFSTSFTAGSNIPEKYTCKGQNINPQLGFDGVPAGAKSLALILDDPDAPSGTFTHWVVYDMPPQTKMIAENSKPPGIQAKNSSGENKYKGPCPPSGTHRYFFKLYALDAALPKTGIGTVDDLVKAMKGHILQGAELMGRFSH